MQQSFRTFRSLAPFLLIICMAIGNSCNPSSQKLKKPPNVLFILADDFGAHDISALGSEFYETPNLDKLAKESMVFTQGYATCQVCSPSRASIMTGKFPATHGITDWIGAPSGTEWRKRNRHTKLLPAAYVRQLDSTYITLPEALKESGYRTFFAGKWHLGSEGSWPEDHGFEINVGGWDAGSPRGGFFDPYKNPNLKNRKPGEHLSMRLALETNQFIQDHISYDEDTPFLAFLSFYAVHSPIQTTQENWRKYRDKADRIGIIEQAFEMGRYLPIRQVQDHPVYAGLVEQMDDAIGVVLDALKEYGLEENTIVIFTSDNGGVAAGDAFATSNKPLRAGKGYQYEGGIREPYFIKVPWLEVAGKTNATPVTGTDFYPTILDLAGLPLRSGEHMDGVSLVPLLKGGLIADRPLIWHYPHYGNQGGEPSSIIRLGNWKLIYYYADESYELFDLPTDPGETTDLSELHKNKVQELSQQMDQFLEEADVQYPVLDPEYDPAKEKDHLERVRTQRMNSLEKQRRQFLSEDFDPGNNWWGSQVQD